jgi:hypothetical protein
MLGQTNKQASFNRGLQSTLSGAKKRDPSDERRVTNMIPICLGSFCLMIELDRLLAGILILGSALLLVLWAWKG